MNMNFLFARSIETVKKKNLSYNLSKIYLHVSCRLCRLFFSWLTLNNAIQLIFLFHVARILWSQVSFLPTTLLRNVIVVFYSSTISWATTTIILTKSIITWEPILHIPLSNQDNALNCRHYLVSCEGFHRFCNSDSSANCNESIRLSLNLFIGATCLPL